jgi:hypothetical protein
LGYNPIIFIAGMPRSGSMWTYNVCRKLIAAAGLRVWPEAVPQDETPAIRHALSSPPAPDQMYCIKTHFEIPLGRPHIRIVCNYRDVRDAMISYMRFMKCDFEKGLGVARGCMRITDHYLAQPHPDVLPVRYDDMTARPRETIRMLADFLGLEVSDAASAEIAASLSRDAVQRHLAGIGAPDREQQQTTSDPHPEHLATAQNLDGSVRMYDSTTGFQSNHISSTRDGEWRTRLSREQQSTLMEISADWLARYHFNP